MNFETTPHQYGEARRKNILAHFGEQDLVEKALSKEAFSERYDVGHDVFTIDDLAKYEVDRKTKEGDTDEVSKSISDEFDTLTPVLIKGTSKGLEKVFVRESKSEETESTTDTEEAASEGSEETV